MVEVAFNALDSTVIFRNMKTNVVTQQSVNIDILDELHFCVVADAEGSKFEYLRS